MPHVDNCPVPERTELRVILQHNEQLPIPDNVMINTIITRYKGCLPPAPGVSPRPGVVYTPVFRLNVDLKNSLKINFIFSCEDAALQVLISVCLSVCLFA